MTNFEQKKSFLMNFPKRKQKILEILAQTGDVEIKSLATELDISEITIRRDLNQLAAEGLLQRTHGGAMPASQVATPAEFVNKATANQAAKDDICRAAATQIEDGDIIFMDCGSTVYRLCQFIKNKKIKVITNSLPVVYELMNTSVSINMVGGEVDVKRQAIHGRAAEEHIRKYRADKAFIGIDGISPNGLFANSENEASITLALAGQSTKVYLLCDASKINREGYLKFAGLDLVNVVVTDKPGSLEFLTTAGAEVICVENVL
jgi:DeoR family fructose operon transcriptional repressor